jgi:hypothetical protein
MRVPVRTLSVLSAAAVLLAGVLATLPASAATEVEVTPAASGVSASADDGNVPANTVDGNLSTRWSALGDGQWIRYDLGKTVPVTRVRIAVYQGDTRRNLFDLQVSTDGSTWRTVWSGQSTGTTTALVSYDFPDATARYVRYVGHGSTVNTWNSLTEVEVYALSGQLVWTADGNVNGLSAFEGCEVPDNSSVPHVYVDNGNYHVVSLKGDDDSAIGTTQRSRTECKGMATGSGSYLTMTSGQTWRFGWDLYIPSTLQGTDHFCHIAQIKAVGVTNVDHPVATLTIYRPASGEVIEVRTANSDTSGDQHLSPIDLNLVRGKWIHTEWEIKIASSGGYVTWTLRDADGYGTRVYVNAATLTGLTTWRTDSTPGDNRLRPKWGIYRYVYNVTPASAIQDTYLLIRHIQAYRVA